MIWRWLVLRCTGGRSLKVKKWVGANQGTSRARQGAGWVNVGRVDAGCVRGHEWGMCVGGWGHDKRIGGKGGAVEP